MNENMPDKNSPTPNEKPKMPEPEPPETVMPNLESLSGFDPMATLQSETVTESSQTEVVQEKTQNEAVSTQVDKVEQVEQQPSTSPPPISSPEVSPEPESEIPVQTIVDESPVGHEREIGQREADRLICSKIRFFCTEHNVALVMKALCERVPEALPNYRTWAIADPIPVIHDKIQTAGYVEKMLPVLKLMLTTNLGNVPWTARVLIAMAVYGAIQELVEA